MPQRGREREASHWPRVYALVRPQRRRVGVLAVTSFLGGVVEALFLVVVTRVALAVADGNERTGLVAGRSLSIGAAIAVAFALIAVRLAFGLTAARLATGLAEHARAEVRDDLSTAYLDTAWAVQQAEPSGRLTQLLTGFTNETANVVTALTASLTALLTLLALVGGAVWVDPLATLAVVTALMVLSALLRPLRRRIKLRAKASARARLEFGQAVSELSALGLEMQTYGVRSQFEERIGALSQVELRTRQRAELLRAALPVIYTSFAYLAVLGGLGVAGVAGSGNLNSVGAVMLVLLRSLTYGQQLQAAAGSMAQALPFLDRLDQALVEYRRTPAVGGSQVPGSVGTIEVRDVSFSYDPDRPVLSDVSFELACGETVGVIGPSGAGKSTLVQLLLGVRQPTSGTVLVSGVDLTLVDRGWWTERVAFVAQEALLFTGTVAENIRFFRDGIDDEAVRTAAGLAHVLADIEALPDGFETHLGERASQLSGGQRQRLSIARALAGRPELLILDEPTSALDVRSESLVRETIADLHGRSTVVIIAHRLSTLEMCDRLLVIEGGRLVAAGRPDALREDSAFYRQALELSGIR